MIRAIGLVRNVLVVFFLAYVLCPCQFNYAVTGTRAEAAQTEWKYVCNFRWTGDVYVDINSIKIEYPEHSPGPKVSYTSKYKSNAGTEYDRTTENYLYFQVSNNGEWVHIWHSEAHPSTIEMKISAPYCGDEECIAKELPVNQQISMYVGLWVLRRSKACEAINWNTWLMRTRDYRGVVKAVSISNC